VSGRERLGAVAATALPVVAIVLFAMCLGTVLAFAGSTFGYDFQAYLNAAHRVLDGQPLYDPTVDVAGGFAIFLYPPPFALAMIPFAWLPSQVATVVWIALLISAFLVGVWVLPVRPSVKWTIVLLAALDWPFLYAMKLGQVGPLLFLVFAACWRWRDHPRVLGLSIAAGAIIKLQPLLLAGWAAGTRRWQAVAWTGVALLVAATIATVAFGPGVWAQYLDLLLRVSSPVTTPHNFTPGAIAYGAGVSVETATLIQYAAMVGVVLIVIAAIFVAPAEVSLLTTVVASQLLSPLLWDHYAVVLLLPTAWLLEHRHPWGVVIPLLTSFPLVGVLPPVVIPVVFGIGLLGPLIVAMAVRPGAAPRAAATA
jgi:Glycosyltransferase family 87